MKLCEEQLEFLHGTISSVESLSVFFFFRREQDATLSLEVCPCGCISAQQWNLDIWSRDNSHARFEKTARWNIGRMDSSGLSKFLSQRDANRGLRYICGSRKDLAIARDLPFVSSIDDDAPPESDDEPTLHEAVSNCIDDALKYAPAGGAAALFVGECADEGETVEIVIWDAGPGIPAEEQP